MGYFVLCKDDNKRTVLARQRPFGTLYDAGKYIKTLPPARTPVVVRSVPLAVVDWVVRKGDAKKAK